MVSAGRRDPIYMSTESAALAFLICTIIICVVGTRVASVADRLADITGIGEALFGAVFLGASTSLPGIVASTSAALDGHADLAFSNALGGIAAQTAFLAVADMFHPRANLEHAAASVPNMMQGTLLLILLMMVLMFLHAPALSVQGVHPGSLLLVLVYVLGVRMISGARRHSTWTAAPTPETVVDRPQDSAPLSRGGRNRLWIEFSVFVSILVVCGHVVARAGAALAARTGLSETVVGGLLVAVTTSLPELVTAVAAVRQGALTLAVGNIIGGNSFDVLFVAAADGAYREGSLYHAVAQHAGFLVALAALLTAVLLLGLLRREKRGIAGIGFESFLILILYGGGVAVLAAG